MGSLKPQDTEIGSTEAPPKKKRGNPNLKKGVKNPYYEKTNNNEQTTQQTQKPMAEEAQVVNDNSTDVKKDIPADNFSDEIPNKEFIPLEGEPRSKDYANLQDTSNPNTQQTVNAGPTTGPGTATDTTNMGHGGDPTNPLGGPAAPLPGQDVTTKAEQAVKIALNLYEKLHGVARHVAKTSEAELNDLHMSGKINLNTPLPLGTGQISISAFVKQLNDEIDENVVVSKQFKDDITPPLTRIAIKNNWGLNDEWYVLALLFEDVTTKGAVLFSMKSACNMILDSCQRMEKEKKEGKPKPNKEEENKASEANNTQQNTNESNIQDINWQDIKDVPSDGK
jgi:hypothetical protein